MEIGACEFDELRTRAHIARLVEEAHFVLEHRPKPEPPPAWKPPERFLRPSKLAPASTNCTTAPVDAPETKTTPGPQGPPAGAGTQKAGSPLIHLDASCVTCHRRLVYCRCGKRRLRL